MTTPWFISLIHELILEDRWISVKSIAEHLTWAGWVHNSWRFGHAEALREVGPKMPEHRSKMSMVPVVWANLEYFRRDPNDFMSWLVTMDKTWLYHYDPETRQQSVEWRHSGSPLPQIITSAKIRWKSSGLDFLGSRRYPPHPLSSEGPNYQRGVLFVSAGAIEGDFEGKPPRGRKVIKGVSFLHDNAPAHRALAAQKKLVYLGFQCLDHPPYSPDLAPSDYHLFPGLKNNCKVVIFRPTRRSLLPPRPGWKTTFWIFFCVACKSYNNGLRSVLSFLGSMLNKSRVLSL